MGQEKGENSAMSYLYVVNVLGFLGAEEFLDLFLGGV
jgi:hypothetical protein